MRDRVKAIRRILAAGAMLATAIAGASAQVQMPDPKQISGVPLPAPELPAGTVSVRVIRGSFANSLPNQQVEIAVDGRIETLRTGEDGRVQLTGIAPGARVQAVAIVGGERLESQTFTMAATGIRIALAATDSAIAAREDEDRKLAAGPAERGTVVFGPESRLIAELRDDRLNLFYILQILNTSRTPVDIGGPVIVDLPRGARGGGVMDGSTPQATVNGPRITVTGPFPPGVTNVNVGFELPYSGDTARVRQRWPIAMQQTNVLAVQVGGLDLVSAQLPNKRQLEDQGQALIFGNGPAIAAGGELSLDITGLPHHAMWPRYLALSLAGVIVIAGMWTGFGPGARRARA
jgi:hypothetical protein